MNQTVAGSKTRKLLLQTTTGAIVGAVVTFLFLEYAGASADIHDPGRLTAIAAGLIYVLMGALVGVGALAPGAGARFLNVEDAQEILDERPKIGLGAVVCILVGVLLIALALTPGGDFQGLLSRDVAAWIVAAAFAGVIVLGFRMRRRVDEFNSALSVEATALAMHICVLLFGGWAALAHLGFVSWIAPLGLLGGFALIKLAAIFFIVGKRGMLMPR